jgi:hypothetical protein
MVLLLVVRNLLEPWGAYGIRVCGRRKVVRKWDRVLLDGKNVVVSMGCISPKFSLVKLFLVRRDFWGGIYPGPG